MVKQHNPVNPKRYKSNFKFSSRLHILAVITLLFSGMQSSLAQLTYEQLYIDYDSAREYKNLKIIPVRTKGAGNLHPELSNTISLPEALNKGLVTIEERGTSSVENVHWLSLYNHSDKNILVTSGEVLSGGRQDRMVTRDTLIPARSGRSDLHVMCVEEGRWSKKTRPFVYERKANLHLRKVLDQSTNQVTIWKEIDRQLTEDTIKNKTLSYLHLGRDKKFAAGTESYMNFFREAFLKSDTSMVGIVCVSGNKVIGTDIFAARQLLYGQLDALLKGYTEEAVVYGSRVEMKDESVEKYLDQFLSNVQGQEEFVKKNGKLFKVNGQVIHLTTY
jgi:hypothetical protein